MNPSSIPLTKPHWRALLRHHLPIRRSPPGFALVVTLSLMVLLTLVAVGMLTLSSISLRRTSSTQAMAEARQNARMSMVLAISQLQSLAGPDTRVTASSTILDASAVKATGVWRSWEGSDHDASGRAILPKYDSKLKSGDPAKSIASSSDGRFLGWLASATAATSPEVKTLRGLSNMNGTGMVPMVSTGSVSTPDNHVFITPTLLEVTKGGTKGAIAWWTSGENSKAMVNTDPAPNPESIKDWQQRLRSNGRADATTFGLDEINNQKTAKHLPTTASLKLVNPSANLKKFHDLTAFSPGLLTNTATGGWRKDLSLMSENYASLPSTKLPFFTVAPGNDLEYSKSQASGNSGNPMLYHWANFGAVSPDQWWLGVPPICSWSALVNFTQQYRNFPSNGNAAKTAMNEPLAFGFPNERAKYFDQVRRIPQLARIQWIYSIGSRKVPGAAPSATATYNPGILVTPVMTLWNPYNVEMKVENYWVDVRFQPTPLEFEMKVAAQTLKLSSRNFMTDQQQYYRHFHLVIKNPFTLAPGASMIFSTTNKAPVINSNSQAIVHLQPGYTPGGGNLYTKIKDNGKTEIAVAASDRFEIKKITYETTDVRDWGGRGEGFGIFFDIRVNDPLFKNSDYPNIPVEYGTYLTPHRMKAAPFTDLGGPSAFSKIYPPITNPVSATASSIDVTAADPGSISSLPVASAVFCYRMASPFFAGSQYRHMYSKGLLQTNPLSGYSDASGHPINALYDFAFQEMNGWNGTSSVYPQWESATGSSYIVSGLAPNDGLTRCVMVELPTRPLQSLPELQHLDARSNNEQPPFQFNIIGNGSAQPLFLPDQVSTGAKSNDDAYLLNHLLFDDWFCSSIAPEVAEFGSSIRRTADQVYRDHLTQEQPLPNRLYLPAPGASSPSLDVAVAEAAVSGARSGVKDAKTGKYPFESIASKLLVNGMFNINSVSLEAWQAMLRQSRDAQVPYLASDGSTKLGAKSSFSYPRTSIAGDQGSNSGSKESNSLFPDAAEFAGNRVLTDEQIDALANEIVSEIKKRGPFLSLSEFVNRQLSTNKDLAIASTIQKSLDNLAKLGSSTKNPFARIQAVATEIKELPPGNPSYQFPEAALGSSAFGVPGWVRQADILRPLAPILSARDDTFTIRAYGDSRKNDAANTIVAKAWCEVTVTRQADYVDPSDPAAVTAHSALMKSAANQRFGRRYQITSFRWLTETEL
jgi:hypothetical protein